MSRGCSFPLVYTLWFQVVEPLCALNGLVLAAFFPHSFLLSVPLPSSLDLRQDAAANDPLTTSLLYQCAGLFAFFALIEMTVTRATSDLKVWRCVAFASAMSDVIHLAGACIMMGAARFWNPVGWSKEETATLGIFWVGLVIKSSLYSGLGLAHLGQ